MSAPGAVERTAGIGAGARGGVLVVLVVFVARGGAAGAAGAVAAGAGLAAADGAGDRAGAAADAGPVATLALVGRGYACVYPMNVADVVADLFGVWTT